jgi:hypothetical protein
MYFVHAKPWEPEDFADEVVWPSLRLLQHDFSQKSNKRVGDVQVSGGMNDNCFRKCTRKKVDCIVDSS